MGQIPAREGWTPVRIRLASSRFLWGQTRSTVIAPLHLEMGSLISFTLAHLGALSSEAAPGAA